MRTVPFDSPAAPGVRSVEKAASLWARMKGLIGRSGLPPGSGMVIERCNAIHTFFMRFPIDAVFFDKDWNPVKTVKNIRPWTFCVWGGMKARRVLETDARRTRETFSSH